MSEIKKVIADEETEDAALRQQHGSKWTRKPSSDINGQYKTVIRESEDKLKQAGAADDATRAKF